MTLLPFADCCLFLGVDPKTLRLWLKSANLSCTVHPTDARLKCLTPSQLQHLANLHGRFLPDPLPTSVSPMAPSLAVGAAPPEASASPLSLGSPSPDHDLRTQLAHLQTVESQLLFASNGDYFGRKRLPGKKQEKLNKKRQ